MRRREFIALLGGAATAWPVVAHAQDRMPVVGLLSSQAADPAATRIAGFLKGLSEAGYADGQNVTIEYRWADGDYGRLPALAADLVRRHVDVIAAVTQQAALLAKAATSTIPIVFNFGGDPVKFGVVASMNRPGGNMTGISMFTAELEAKRLGLFHEMVPNIRAVAILINPTNANAENQTKEMQSAARELGLEIRVQRMSSEGDLDTAFAGIAQSGAGGICAAADPFLASQREKLVALANKYAVPAMWEWPDFVEGGGLMSYGTSIVDAYRQIGVYTGRVLKGEKPADMPVVRPVKFELAVNLKTAKSLGIEVPATILARADQVIE
jgi:putative ABC transport system substrate-binding protein